MSTPPPLPFGDPENINREHSAAVRKGVSIGCGVMAAVGVAILAMIVGIVFLVLHIIRSADACVMTLKAAQNSEVMRQELGEPIAMGWLVTGNISTTNDTGKALVTVPLSGPRGDARVHTEGTHNGGVWTFQRMEATIEKTGQRVDLR